MPAFDPHAERLAHRAPVTPHTDSTRSSGARDAGLTQHPLSPNNTERIAKLALSCAPGGPSFLADLAPPGVLSSAHWVQDLAQTLAPIASLAMSP
jgi:hypothetical protein